MWGSIILLAIAAAVYPQLLAVVVIILTRPNPQPLVWACYLASLLVSVGSGVLIFAVFQSRGSVAGTSSHRLGSAAYLTVGAIAVLVAVLISTRRGRAVFDRDRQALHRADRRPRPGSAAAARTRARAERALSEGSVVVACLVGALLAVPGPFDLVALGRLARGGYGLVAAAGAMVVFALIKFILIEVPIAGYTIEPGGTAATVSRFSRWMQTNKLAGIAAIVGLLGVALIGRGISGLG
jgi:Sap, sulfolipid-1-addressing protein